MPARDHRPFTRLVVPTLAAAGLVSLLILASSCGGGSGGGSLCGNGTLDAEEVCDDGNRVDGDGCSASCAQECGDGFVDADDSDAAGFVEACDDGNLDPGDGCSPVCALECGDGEIDRNSADGYREQCDDGNRSDDDACRNDCTTRIDRCPAFVELERIVPETETCGNGDQKRIRVRNDSFCFLEVVNVTIEDVEVREVGRVDCGADSVTREPNVATLVEPNSVMLIDRSRLGTCSDGRVCVDDERTRCDETVATSAMVRYRARRDLSAEFLANELIAPTVLERDIGLCRAR